MKYFILNRDPLHKDLLSLTFTDMKNYEKQIKPLNKESKETEGKVEEKNK